MTTTKKKKMMMVMVKSLEGGAEGGGGGGGISEHAEFSCPNVSKWGRPWEPFLDI
jgi:hypothetical protein